MDIKFHWRMLQGGEQEGGSKSRALGSLAKATGLSDLQAQLDYCRAAEYAGIDGLLVDIGASKPDPLLTTSALGLATEKIRFIVAARSGLQPPTTFVQQINTLSSQMGGDRLLLNMVAGHSPKEQRYYGDFLDHDQRYARTEEFLEVCHRFWQQSMPVEYSGRFFRIEKGFLNTPYTGLSAARPHVFIAGGSAVSRDLAVTQGDTWMRLADTPEAVSQSAQKVLTAGKELGLRLAVMVRPTRAQALEAARALLDGLERSDGESALERRFVSDSDSVSMKATYALADEEWLTPTLWTGAIRTHGAPAACLVGDPDEVAQALMDYKKAGVSQFILSGWPKRAEMEYFGEAVIPRVRRLERGGMSVPSSASSETRQPPQKAGFV